jgi:hypothetical protein
MECAIFAAQQAGLLQDYAIHSRELPSHVRYSYQSDIRNVNSFSKTPLDGHGALHLAIAGG